MKKRVIFLNLLMLVVVVILGYKLKNDGDQQERNQNVGDFLKKLPKPTPPTVTIPEIKNQKPTFQPIDVAYIGDNNLFHQDRNMLMPEQQVANIPPPRLQNPPDLLGIITIDGSRSALVRPSRQGGAGGSKKSLLSIGDKWEEQWTVQELDDEKIVLVAVDARQQEIRQEFLLREPNRHRSGPMVAGPPPSTRPNSQSVLTIGRGGSTSQPYRAAAAPPPPASPIAKQTTPVVATSQSQRQGNAGEGAAVSRSDSFNNLFRSNLSTGQPSRVNTGQQNSSQRTNPFANRR